MIILRLLFLLTNLHLKLLSTQGTGADKLLSTQELSLFWNRTNYDKLSLYVREDQAIRFQLTFLVCESEPFYEQLKL